MEPQVRSIEETGYGFGLTESEVRRLQGIIRRDCGIELTLEQAWARGIELLAFAKMLVESQPPETTSAPEPPSSHFLPLD